MPSIDLTRHATDFRKHYTGVRMGQGQLLTDEAFNEAGRLDYEDLRRTRVHVIGPAGSPDGGFRISQPVVLAGGKIDFTIEPGTLYAGGLRLTLEARPAPGKETYRTQRDWLRVPAPDADPALALGAGQARRDFAFLEAWIQPVSSVEDGENLEVAIGADAPWRTRAMRRVRVLANIGANVDCNAALQAAANAMGGTLAEDNEVVVDARLQVIYDGGNQADDLCSPKVKGGYLGAENQAIRVQLTSANTFTWGYDNAAPLYRVRVAPGANAAAPYVVTMDTEPRDEFHWPLHGMIVELLPWSAVLPNETDAAGNLVRGEKIAELSGHFARVDGAYDPDSRTFTVTDLEPVAGLSLANGVPGAFGEEWRARPDAAQLGQGFYFARVWNRGDDVASPAHIPIANAALPAPLDSAPLGNTGLRVKITGLQKRARDYWIIAARPEASDDVVPWQLESARPPHGVRRYVAPLGILEWKGLAGGAIQATTPVHDCRPGFLPLTRIKSCCTYTVGDGVTSVGHFKSIQEAVDALPASGGEVCVLPGKYRESVVIRDRKDVMVHGCGRRSEVTAAATPGGPLGPVFTIARSKGIKLERMALVADAAFPGVLLPAAAPSANISLVELHILSGPKCSIEADDIEQLLIRDCDCLMLDAFGPNPAIFTLGRKIEILHNFVSVKTDAAARAVAARGGIQIGGGSIDVRIIDNLVVDGLGNGITLGSLETYSDDGKGIRIFVIVDEGDDCHPGGSHIVVIEIPGRGPTRVVSEGPLEDILIERNRIYRMGLNGIGMAGFFDVADVSPAKGIGGLPGLYGAKARVAKKAAGKTMVGALAKDAADYGRLVAAQQALLQTGKLGWDMKSLLAGFDLPVAAIEASEMIRVTRLHVLGNWIVGCLRHELQRVPDAMADFMGYGGIALADCRYLVVRDNLIAKNGRSWLDPVCGLFVLAASALEIHRNHLLDNGPSNGQSPANALAGTRGGIHIALATPLATGKQKPDRAGARPYEMPAVHIADNVVVQPLGRALSLTCLGSASILGNHFASGAIDERRRSLQGACVRVSDLGRSNEVPLVLAASLLKAVAGIAAGATGPAFDKLCAQFAASAGRDTGWSRALPTGKLMFDDNQVVLELDREGRETVVATLLVSFDDLSCQDNQIECNLDDELSALDLVAIAPSLRANGNRLSDSLRNAAQLSGLTAGLLNTTSLNQSTWCLDIRGPRTAAGAVRPDVVVATGNSTLVDLFCPNTCGRKQGDAAGKYLKAAEYAKMEAEASQFASESLTAHDEFAASVLGLRLARLAQMRRDVKELAEMREIAPEALADERYALHAEALAIADWLRAATGDVPWK